MVRNYKPQPLSTRKPVRGQPRTRNRSEVALFIPNDLLDKLNDVWLASDQRFFSAFICGKLKELVR